MVTIIEESCVCVREAHYVGQVKKFSDLLLLISKFIFNHSSNVDILNVCPSSEASCTDSSLLSSPCHCYLHIVRSFSFILQDVEGLLLPYRLVDAERWVFSSHG